MATIDNLDIQISASADGAIRSLDRLASSASRLRTSATSAGNGMRDMAQGAQDAGTAASNASDQAQTASGHVRAFGQSAVRAGANARRGTAGIADFWNALKRVAYYRFIRFVLKEIVQAFKEGITNLYHWSDAVNGHFAQSMDRLATSTQYLKNSLGAMVSPLIELLVPALDTIIDKIVDVLNFFNMLTAAVSGADTYTVAKKAAAVWDDSASKTTKAAKSASNELKRTILGFDEINKLVKDTTSSSGSGSSSGKKTPNYSEMFEERPLEGIFKSISDITSGWPDWLKWLLGIGGAAAVGWGLTQIPKLLGTIWDLLKKLFTMTIPNWFKWLFGPKGDGDDNGINLPDELNFPDADIVTNIKKGDWSALDDLDNKPVYLSPKFDNKPQVLRDRFVNEWSGLPSRTLYFSPKPDNTPQVLFNGFKKDWNNIPSKTLYMSPKLDNTAKTLYEKFKKEWLAIGALILYMTPKLDNTARALYNEFVREWDKSGSKTLYFSPKLDNTAKALFNQFKKDWNGLSTIVYISPKLDNKAKVLFDQFKKDWNALTRTVYVSPKLDNTASVMLNEYKKAWNNLPRILYVSPKLDNTAQAMLNAFKTEWGKLARIVYVSPKLDNTPSVLLNEFIRAWNNLVRTVYVSPKLDNTASVVLNEFKNAWNGLIRTVYVSPKLDNTARAMFTAFKYEWDSTKPTVSVNVQLKKDGWTTVTDTIDNNFGGATGGGGTASGGGAGRRKYDVGVSLSEYQSTSQGLDLWGMWKKIFNKTLKVEQDVALKLVKTWAGTPKDATGLNNLDSTAKIDVSTAWGYWGRSLRSWIGLDDLKGDAWVECQTQWGYWGKTLRDWLGLNDLNATATITTNYVTNGGGGGGNTKMTKALGGVYSNGAWHDIPQYARGGVAHGTLFWAGENGAEIVGNAGGRTEVLNASQLASVMYSSVKAAMSGVSYDVNFNYSGGEDDGYNIEELVEMTARQNELIREQNSLLRQINAKDYNLEISTASINKAQTRANRRAGTTLVPVGT